MDLTITNPPPPPGIDPARCSRQIPSAVQAALIGFLMAGLAALARAQYQPPPPPLTSAPCVPTKKDPCTQPVAPPPAAGSTAERFPFPGETPNDIPPEIDARKPNPEPAPPPGPAPSHQEAPRPASPGPAQRFPFPGEPEESSSASSSSSSAGAPDAAGADDADAAAPRLKDAGSSGSTRASRRRHLPKVEDMDEREAKDLEVSHYYVTTGNFLGAYLRAKDAVTTIPDDPQAHFAVAETARRLNKRDEAIAEYTLYLKLEPDGDKSAAAKRALTALGPR